MKSNTVKADIEHVKALKKGDSIFSGIEKMPISP